MEGTTTEEKIVSGIETTGIGKNLSSRQYWGSPTWTLSLFFFFNNSKNI